MSDLREICDQFRFTQSMDCQGIGPLEAKFGDVAFNLRPTDAIGTNMPEYQCQIDERPKSIGECALGLIDQINA